MHAFFNIKTHMFKMKNNFFEVIIWFKFTFYIWNSSHFFKTYITLRSVPFCGVLSKFLTNEKILCSFLNSSIFFFITHSLSK